MLPNIQMDFRKEYKLIAQTPQIHFQAYNTGASLRASEVKPKLDRYLIRKFTQNGTDYSKWLIKDQAKALDYKLHITPGLDKRNGMDITQFKNYYGNQGIHTDATPNGINESYRIKDIIFRDCTLEIICFHSDLMEQIDRYIGDFFIVTNFGTLQSKGFGGYIVEEKKPSQTHIINTLFEDSGSKYCYLFNGFNSLPKTFDAIRFVYSLLKSGVNLQSHKYKRSILVQYMHKYERSKSGETEAYGIGNEKAWLKQNELAPALFTRSVYDSEFEPEIEKLVSDRDVFYVRALLGIGDRLLFKNPQGTSPARTTVRIKCADKEPGNDELLLIERYSSPIRFKVIDNTVYYISYPPDEKIFGCTFTFSSNYTGLRRSRTLRIPPTLSIPTKEALGDEWSTIVERFLVYAYLNYFKNDPKNYLGEFDETQNIKIEGRVRR